MSAGVLLLAAGRARRFGSDKRRACLPAGPALLQATVDKVLAAELPLCVCLGPGDLAAGALLTRRGVSRVECPGAARGMGHTLAEGMARAPVWDVTLVALADMPWVAPESYRAVASAGGRSRIVVPTLSGRHGHPVAFGAAFYPALTALRGDRGARDVLARHANAVRELPLLDPGILCDVDRPADLLARPWEPVGLRGS
jgi:molybdenum cofactor cytidylyltransferase